MIQQKYFVQVAPRPRSLQRTGMPACPTFKVATSPAIVRRALLSRCLARFSMMRAPKLAKRNHPRAEHCLLSLPHVVVAGPWGSSWCDLFCCELLSSLGLAAFRWGIRMNDVRPADCCIDTWLLRSWRQLFSYRAFVIFAWHSLRFGL